MNKSTLEKSLKDSVCVVEFTKKSSNEVRKMVCTQNTKLCPETSGNTPKRPPGLVVVYDVENDGYRSFYKDSVISFREVGWTDVS